MLKLWVFFALVSHAAAAPTPAAATAAPQVAPGSDATAALEALQYFVGEWHAEDMPGACDPHALQSPQRDGIKLIVHRAVGGAWFAFSWLSYQAGQRSEGITLMSYDASQKQYAQHDTHSGGAHGQAVAAGWQHGTLVFTGTLHNWQGRSLALRKTYRKLTASRFTVTVEGNQGGRGWEQLERVTFRR